MDKNDLYKEVEKWEKYNAKGHRQSYLVAAEVLVKQPKDTTFKPKFFIMPSILKTTRGHWNYWILKFLIALNIHILRPRI